MSQVTERKKERKILTGKGYSSSDKEAGQVMERGETERKRALKDVSITERCGPEQLQAKKETCRGRSTDSSVC